MTASGIRCFFAFNLPEPAVAWLSGLQGKLKRRGLGFQWARPETMHLTMKFVGEVDEGVFDRLRTVAWELDRVGPLSLNCRGFGGFPSVGKARVVWAGIEGDVAKLVRLGKNLDELAASCGITRSRRPFSPHLTLGRVRGRGSWVDVSEPAERWAAERSAEFELRELVFFESRLEPAGAIHLERATYDIST